MAIAPEQVAAPFVAYPAYGIDAVTTGAGADQGSAATGTLDATAAATGLDQGATTGGSPDGSVAASTIG